MSVPDTGNMRPIYSDYVPRWVPMVAGALIVFGAWFGGNIAHLDLQFTTTAAIFLLGLLIVVIFFQGRYYWRGQIKTVSTDGMRYEAVTSVWVGPGRRIAFAATEAKNWMSKTGAVGPDGTRALPSAIGFTLRGEKMSISLVNPEQLDLDAMSGLNPAWFHKLRSDYPALKSTKT